MPSTQTDRVMGAYGGLGLKSPVKIASTANLTLSGEQTIDGVAVVDGDRVLVKDQTSQPDNGIYIVSTGSWTRAPDFDGVNDIRKGTLVFSAGGTVGGGLLYQVTAADVIDIDTDNITFSVLSNYSATAFAQTLLAAASAAAARTVLGLGIATDVQAYDAFLTSIASLGTAADKMIYTTAVNTAAETALTAFARTLLDDSDAATARATLGVTNSIYIKKVVATDATMTTGTTTIPLDDTIPQNTEGIEAITATITPASAANRLLIKANIKCSHTVGNGGAAIALFQDSTANALTAQGFSIPDNAIVAEASIFFEMAAGTTSATTFKIRVGHGSAGTLTINGVGGARRYGGVQISYLEILEVSA